MKKIALLFVMVFVFSLTQANNYVIVKKVLNQNTTSQAISLNNLGINGQTAAIFQMTTAEAEMQAVNHAKKAKKPKADKKPKVKKEHQKKSEQARKAEHQKKEQARKVEHHHHKKTNKK